jgi:hypothetical protein
MTEEKDPMTTRLLSPTQGMPWYREPWPWILMAGPVTAVVAGAITLWIAVTHQDALVADDYYKRGLAINQTLEKERRAAALGLAGPLQVGADGLRVRVVLDGQAGASRLSLRLAHATVADLDQKIMLERSAGGWYEGTLVAPLTGRWKLLLEDPDGAWRLTGSWAGDGEGAATLTSLAR